MTAHKPLVGQPVERVEDPRLLRGKGRYTDDIHREGMLHAAILRSAVAHGRILEIDATEARALPGVHSVLTADDLNSPVPCIPIRLFPNPKMDPFRQPVIATGKVRYVGEALAIVVADSAAIAEDALELISAEIEPLNAVADMETHSADKTLLFDGQDSNHVWKYDATLGEADKAFDGAHYTRRERFYVHRHTGITMETRGVVSEWDPVAGKMTCWGAAKVPYQNRKMLAEMLGLPEASVELVEGDTGGSFGVRGEFFPEDYLVPYAARLLNRPVKWIEDRREHLLAVSHARDVACDIEIACDADGRVLAIRANAVVDIGAYIRTATTITPRNVATCIPGPYRVPNFSSTVSLLVSNKSPTGTYRGPGRFEADFFRERMFDLVAADFGMDQVQFRRRNLLTEEELPHPLPSVSPDPHDSELDSGAYEEVLDRCLKKIGWEEKQSVQGQRIDGRYHGLAVGCFVEGGGAGPSENCRMVLEKDGMVSVYVGSSAVGQGLQTIMSQIAADAMELPLDRIRLFHGSTSFVKQGFGSFHSRSTVMGGNATLIAAKELKAQILGAGAKILQVSGEDVRYENGAVISNSGGSVGLDALGENGLSYEATFKNSKHTYSYGTHAVHVAVDSETGELELIDYVAIEDAGRIINPLTLHGQAVGSIVQGLGGALLEHLIYDSEGQLLVGTLADYLVPLATDFPNIRSESIALRRSPNHPLGAKGAGEGGTIPVGALIANSVAAALADFKVQPFDLPLSPDRIWRLIENASDT